MHAHSQRHTNFVVPVKTDAPSCHSPSRAVRFALTFELQGVAWLSKSELHHTFELQTQTALPTAAHQFPDTQSVLKRHLLPTTY